MDLNTAQGINLDTDLGSEQLNEDWFDWLSSPYYTLIAGMLCGLVVNLLSRPAAPRTVAAAASAGGALATPSSSRPISMPSFITGNCSKMVLVVRTDLGMGKGKAAAQCAHAALDCYKKAVKRHQVALTAWETTGQAKVCLKIDSEEALLELAAKAKSNGINWAVVRDAGRTQVESGSLTVLGLGPAKVAEIDKITGHLKLY